MHVYVNAGVFMHACMSACLSVFVRCSMRSGGRMATEGIFRVPGNNEVIQAHVLSFNKEAVNAKNKIEVENAHAYI